jgi:CCR4-NOT transcription complex subunit 1
LHKIVIAQVFLLLSSMKEDRDPAKWESQADQIRKLVGSNGMEVFAKYFRRLVTGNAPQIFPNISRAVENPGNYPLLVSEIHKVTQDRAQAHKIAETIDTSDGDIFKDFDLALFLDHFGLDALEKSILALAFESVSRSDLRQKASIILSKNADSLLEILAQPADSSSKYGNISLPVLQDIIQQVVRSSAPGIDDTFKLNLAYCIRIRYQKRSAQMPAELESALESIENLDQHQGLVQILRRRGPEGTLRIESCKNLLKASTGAALDEAGISDGLVFILSSPDWQSYHLSNLIEVLDTELGPHRLDWNKVVRFFDRDNFAINADQFLVLFKALLPIAQKRDQFNLQHLWGGRWNNAETHLTFLLAYLSQRPPSFDASDIPSLQPSFTLNDFSDAPEAAQTLIARAMTLPLISVEAVKALFVLSFETADERAVIPSRQIFEGLMNSDLDLLLCGLFASARPWSDAQQAVLSGLFRDVVSRSGTGYDFALRLLWKKDKQWVATRLVELHSRDPMRLPQLFDLAVEQQWLDDLHQILNGFGLDMAAQAHRRGLIQAEQWAQQCLQRRGPEFPLALARFLTIKAEDEVRTQRSEQESPRTISLAIKTVNAMLEVLEQVMPDNGREELIVVQRLCVQAYPRLINYGEGFDDVIDANSERSHAIPPSADEKMQEHYGGMYSGELDVKSIVEALPADQELFACMIHGLFDEYSCFRVYPLEALATTAVLFGGIISYRLVSGIPLRVALGMILEAVRNFGTDTSMYKFGLQALLHFSPRLPEWPGFCAQLVEIPGLRGTDVYAAAENVFQNQPAEASAAAVPVAASKAIAPAESLTNGNGNPPVNGQVARFTSVNVEPSPYSDRYEDPDENVQDQVLFVLNNVSEQNLDIKLQDLLDHLQTRHHQWFAHYIVEQRAKLQPNYQQLYLDMLEQIDDRSLWTEVLRQTYASCITMLNAEATMAKSNERTLLKNLGGWLGSITIARNKPIKFKNISFKDLLIEGYDSQRLIIVIPFVCKVLLQAAKSTVFRPPNPWLMDIVRMLIELYRFAEMKLNLKFEIEVLCKELDLDHLAIEPSTGIRDRPRLEEEAASSFTDNFEVDDFGVGLPGNRSARHERFSPTAISSSLPSLGPLLNIPTLPGINKARLHTVVESAIQRAIQDIISQVVERSVTIAAIASAQLVQKDFAMEPSEERVKQSALAMVKELAGSLAQVTCKEPLRITMTNLIRSSLQQIVPNEQQSLEGVILMCVNDNLDIACSMFAKAAEDRSIPEIEEQLEGQLALRRRHQLEKPNEPFVDRNLTSWAFYLPEPYRLKPNGLNREQMAIYDNFGRVPLVPSSRAGDSARQSAADLPPEAYQAIGAQTETSTTPLPGSRSESRGLPTHTHPGNGLPRHEMNGLIDPKSIVERVQASMNDLHTAIKESNEQRFADLSPSSPVMEYFNQVVELTLSSPHRESITLRGAQSICNSLFTQTEDQLEVETFVELLQRFCQISEITTKEVSLWLASQEDSRMFNVPVTVALLTTGLLQLDHLDLTLKKAIQSRKPVAAEAVDFLSELVDEILLISDPVALRADFAGSIEAVGQWVREEPNLTGGVQLLKKLRDSGMATMADRDLSKDAAELREQIEYVFSEWVQLCNSQSATEKLLVAFVSQLYQQRLLANENISSFFIRVSIDMCIEDYERELQDPESGFASPYTATDALAKLIMMLVRYQDADDEDDVAEAKGAYFSSILSIIVLVLNHHSVMRGVNFNQKVFFRLFSTILCEYKVTVSESDEEQKHLVSAFSDALLTLQPAYFPGFAFAWLALVSHRIFLPEILSLPDQAGWTPYTKLLEAALIYVSEQLRAPILSPIAKSLNTGLLKIILVLHHDFADFLAENYFRLCEVIPLHCMQFRNLILSAYPSNIPDLQDPLTSGLRIDRLPEMQVAPVVLGEPEAAFKRSTILANLEKLLSNTEIKDADEHLSAIVSAVSTPQPRLANRAYASANVDVSLINALVYHVGVSASSSASTTYITTSENKNGTNTPSANKSINSPTISLDTSSPVVTLLTRLIALSSPEVRYYLLNAIVTQLRYPNSHTTFFHYITLHLFTLSLPFDSSSSGGTSSASSGSGGPQERDSNHNNGGSTENGGRSRSSNSNSSRGSSKADDGAALSASSHNYDVQQQITRVLMERLIVHRPHPWGFILTLTELLRNERYAFWDLDFIKAAPEIRQLNLLMPDRR